MGAVALVFSREAVMALLKHPNMVDRICDPQRGWRAVDGGVVEAMRQIGWREYVHNPSLVLHTGARSSMGNRRFPDAPSFRGEGFDAMELLGLHGPSPEVPKPFVPPPPPPVPDRQRMVEYWEGSPEFEEDGPQAVLRTHDLDLETFRGRKVLDVGPGSGALLELLQGRGCEVYAADISAKALDRIRPMVSGAWDVGGLPTATFDLIICHRIAQYTADADLVEDLSGLFNSLRHDGVLSLQFSSGPSGPESIENQKAGKVYRTAERMQVVIRDAGGEVSRLVCSVPVSVNVTWLVFHCRSKT